MRKISQNLRHSLVLGLFIVLATGCITTEQVKEIVVSSNAAMISSSLDAPGGKVSGEWKEPVAQLDQLITQNADQPTLVNHLRVRQAMLLTVHQQDNLATARWKQVVPGALKTERDKGLLQNWEALVWWYKRAPVMSPLDPGEKSDAAAFVTQLDDSLEGVIDQDLGFYLGTVRVQMSLRLLNDSDVSTSVKQQQVSNDMVDSLEKYINLFSEDDKTWLNSSDRVDLSNASEIADFRRRFSLSGIVEQFCKLTDRLELDTPNWKPEGEGWNWKKLCKGDS